MMNVEEQPTPVEKPKPTLDEILDYNIDEDHDDDEDEDMSDEMKHCYKRQGRTIKIYEL